MVYLTHRCMGFTWIAQEVDKDSKGEKKLHVLSVQQKKFHTNEVGGSKTNTNWRTQIAWKQYLIKNCGKTKVCVSGWLIDSKRFCGLIFRQLSKVCDRKCSKSSVRQHSKVVCVWLVTHSNKQALEKRYQVLNSWFQKTSLHFWKAIDIFSNG